MTSPLAMLVLNMPKGGARPPQKGVNGACIRHLCNVVAGRKINVTSQRQFMCHGLKSFSTAKQLMAGPIRKVKFFLPQWFHSRRTLVMFCRVSGEVSEHVSAGTSRGEGAEMRIFRSVMGVS